MRRGVAAWALCAALLGGCEARDPAAAEDPKEALTTFIAAVYAQRGEVAYAMLTPAAQAELERRAAELNKASGGAEAIKAPELLTSAGALGPHHVARMERVEASGEEAVYAVRTHDEREFKVRLERVEGIWRVDVGALPPAPTVEEAGR